MKKFPILLVLVLLVVLTVPAFADSATIPFPADYDTTSSGASSYQNSGDHTD